MIDHRFPPRHLARRVAAALLLFGAQGIAPLAAQTPRDALLAAKRVAVEANFRNDQPALRTAAAQLDALASHSTLGARALYWAGWTRWMIAASQIAASDNPSAMSTLEASVRDLTRAMEARPDDADSHALMAWVLTAITVVEPARRRDVGATIASHRARAIAIAPANPRVVIMDAGLTFYTPPQFGGSQERGIARWLEGMRLFERERIADPVEPDWGRTLAYGWLANIYLAMTPPNVAEARRMSAKALELRPDFWFVTDVVGPRLRD